MDISQIKSIELDRTVLFDHKVRIKDSLGYDIQVVPVKENVEWEQYMLICQKWMQHPDFNPSQPTTQELYEKRKK